MRWYAETTNRLVRQVVADAAALVWLLIAVLVGRTVHDGLQSLQAPGQSVVDAGSRASQAFSGVAGAVEPIPFIGGDLARALGPATAAGSDLAAAGRQFGTAVETTAVGAMIVVPVVLLMPVLLGWLPLRLNYARRAANAIVARSTAPDLLAIRALARVRVDSLTRIAPDPASAWRDGDPEVVRRLADLELRSLGLKPCPVTSAT